MRHYPAFVLMLPMAFFSGCGAFDAPTVVGSGVIKTETRTVADCSEIELYGIGELTIRIGDQPSLTVTADDNMLEYVLSEASGNRLRIGVGSGNYTWTGFPKMELTVSSLDLIKLSGQTQAIALELDNSSLNVEADGQCTITLGGKIEHLTIDISGQSICSAAGIEGASASIAASGQCSVVLAGKIGELAIDIDGQSNCDASQLEADTATVQADGQCSISLSELQTVDGEIGGATNVTYRGDPEVNVSTSGMATVSKLE